MPQAKKIILLYGYSRQDARQIVDVELKPAVICYLVRAPAFLWHILSFLYVLFISVRYRPSLVQVDIRAPFAESLAAKIFRRPVIGCLRIIPFRRRQLWPYFLVDHLVCVSSAVYRQSLFLGWKKGATIIHNGVEVAKFIDVETDVPGRSSRFYTLSRLVHWKRPDWFVRAAPIILARDPGAKFYVFGEGPMKDELNELIRRLEVGRAVRLMGHTHPNSPPVSRCGIFVMPSYEEPFGRTLIEAVLQSKVVVASRSGAAPELLAGSELLFARDDADDLARQMIRASAEYEEHRLYIRKLRVRFLEQFNLDRLAKDYILTYTKLTSSE